MREMEALYLSLKEWFKDAEATYSITVMVTICGARRICDIEPALWLLQIQTFPR